VKSLYATIVNEQYALRALVLYKSFAPVMGGKIFSVYCTDQGAVNLLNDFTNDSFVVVPPDSFENVKLSTLKVQRAINEYCWTCKPVILEHAIEHFPEIEWVVYLDSDMMAFGDPDDGLPTDMDINVVVTPHRPSSDYFAQFMDSAGQYNAGYVAFKNSEVGRAALRWWKDRCIECCPNTPENGAYADQKYLDYMVTDFSGVLASSNVGLNAGPWNISGREVCERDGVVFVDDTPLLLYHMQAFRIYSMSLFDIYGGPVRIAGSVRQAIYRPYESLIASSWKILKKANPSFKQNPDTSIWKTKTLLRELKKIAQGISNLRIRF